MAKYWKINLLILNLLYLISSKRGLLGSPMLVTKIQSRLSLSLSRTLLMNWSLRGSFGPSHQALVTYSTRQTPTWHRVFSLTFVWSSPSPTSSSCRRSIKTWPATFTINSCPTLTTSFTCATSSRGLPPTRETWVSKELCGKSYKVSLVNYIRLYSRNRGNFLIIITLNS